MAWSSFSILPKTEAASTEVSGKKSSPVENVKTIRREGFGNFLPGRIYKVARFVVGDDSYDLKICVARGISILLVKRGEFDFLAERIFVGKILASEGLIDDHDVAGSGYVIFGEDAAAEQRDAESFEIVFADGLVAGFPGFRVGAAGNDDVGQVGIQRRLFIAFRGGEYARDGFHAIEKLAGDSILADSDVYDGGGIAPTEIVGVGPNEFEVEKIFWVEAKIDAGEN